MLLLLLEKRSGHGYDLHRRLAALRLGDELNAVYRTLKRFERSGWATSSMTTGDGPQRRVYCLTPKGRRELEATTERITAVRDCHDMFLRAYEQACELRHGPAPADTT